MSEVNAVGASIAPLESDEKLSGRAQYIADLQRPGLLHAAIVQSPHAHARIKGYDLKAALAHVRGRTRVPLLTGLPFGHVSPKLTLPVGRRVELVVQGREVLLGWGHQGRA